MAGQEDTDSGPQHRAEVPSQTLELIVNGTKTSYRIEELELLRVKVEVDHLRVKVNVTGDVR